MRFRSSFYHYIQQALIGAVMQHRYQMVQLLLQLKINPNILNLDRFTPLDIAAMDLMLMQNVASETKIAQQVTMIERLIKAGAKLFNIDPVYENLLYISVKRNNFTLLNACLNAGAHIDSSNQQGITALHAATMQGNFKVVNYLIELGADLNLADNMGNTPLYTAVSKENLNLVRALIIAGANVNPRDCHDNTPLHEATYLGNLPIIKYLISSGAKINVKNRHDDMPLHIAAEMDYSLITYFLIEQNADIDSRNFEGNTILHEAIENNNFEIVCALINAKAKLNVQNIEYQTPLDMALTKKNIPISQALTVAGGKTGALDDDNNMLIGTVQLLNQINPSLLSLLPCSFQSYSMAKQHLKYLTSMIANQLKSHYQQQNISLARTELLQWINQLTIEDAEPLDIAVAKCHLNQLATIDFVDKASKVTLQEALGLAWLSINRFDQPLTDGMRSAYRLTLLPYLGKIISVTAMAQPDFAINARNFSTIIAMLGPVQSQQNALYFEKMNDIQHEIDQWVKQKFMQLPHALQQHYALQWTQRNGMPTALIEPFRLALTRVLSIQFIGFEDLVKHQLSGLSKLALPIAVIEQQAQWTLLKSAEPKGTLIPTFLSQYSSSKVPEEVEVTPNQDLLTVKQIAPK